ncbi:hypothetical protein HPB47_003562 [Ixodes persulcatus]|uniref:Uncharacterized protein n=1 Tax=Ixodes persulcatus TaxID=34615 RepID=A0AC60PJJ3_IXOPE|nr:hypothetical protein HPB47_003562 [Ixodes persulcatus]
MKQGARVLARSVGSETPSIIALGHAEATPAAKQAQRRVVTPLADARTYPKPFHQIPGPKPSLPLIGTSWQYFRWGRYSLYQLHEACADKYRRYGDIMKEEYQWQVPIVHAFNPEDFETIFRHQGRCPIRPANEFVRKYRTEHPHKYSSVGLSNAADAGKEKILNSIFMLCLDTRLGCLSRSVNYDSDAAIVITAAKDLFSAYQKLYYGLPLLTLSYLQKYANHDCKDSAHAPYAKHTSLLHALLNTEGLSEKDVHLTIMDFIAGGVFTTTNALCFLLHHLACNPGVQEKLHGELQASNGDISSCSYLRACMKESFRLNPTVPGVMRILPEDVVLSGYHVPAGVPVFANSLVTCHLEKYFAEPEAFRPERWLGAERTQIHPFSLLPFGHGARMCAGRRFAELELMTAAAKVVQNFVVEPCSRTLNTSYVFVVVPSHPVGLRFYDRVDH